MTQIIIPQPHKPLSDADVDQFVSVIVPVYNVERYVDACMLSLRAQNHENFEIIIVNDGSEDGSMERVQGHASMDHRIRIINQQNLGLGGARNTGLAHASGEFIVFVDSDDFVSVGFLRTLLDAQRSGDYDVVSGRHIKILENSDFLEYERRWPLPDFMPPLSDYEKVLGMFAYSVAWARLIKRRILIDADLPFPERLPHEDLFFTYKLLRRRPNHIWLDDHIYFWRQREQSLSKSLTEDHFHVPSRLRRDTYDFLDRVSAPGREYSLAARRNIAFLRHLHKLARSDPKLSERFEKNVRADASEISEDFDRISDASSNLLLEAEDLRQLLNTQKIAPQSTKAV